MATTKYFLGFDPSLCSSGLTLLDDESNLTVSTTLSVPQVGVERLAFLRAKLHQTLDNYEITFAAIEAPSMNSAVGLLHDLGCWHGQVLLYLYDRGIPCVSVSPTQTKKYVSGSGKSAGKAVILLDVYKYYGVEFRQDDLADSYVIANIAKDYYSAYIEEQDLIDLPKHRKEVLTKMRSSSFVNKNLII